MAGSAARRISVSSEAMVQQEAPSHEYSDTCRQIWRHFGTHISQTAKTCKDLCCIDLAATAKHQLSMKSPSLSQHSFVALAPMLSSVASAILTSTH